MTQVLPPILALEGSALADSIQCPSQSCHPARDPDLLGYANQVAQHALQVEALDFALRSKDQSAALEKLTSAQLALDTVLGSVL